MDNRVNHFDLMADKPERAVKFYSQAFNWKFDKWEGGGMEYWLIKTGKGKGIDGGMGKKNAQSMGVVITISVDSIDKAIEKVLSAGGKMLSKKMPIEKVGWFASFMDPEGNKLGLMQADKKAKAPSTSIEEW